MNFSSDDLPETSMPTSKPADAFVEGRASSPVQAERSSADTGAHSDSGFSLAAEDGQPTELVPAAPAAAWNDPAWNGWDVVRLIFLAIVALFAGVFTVLLIARWRIYPHASLGEIARVPLVVVAGQALAYLLILAYMYVLVTR
ncbi:MAG: hypothetical protein WAM98_19745, partial [Terriglobales bacterium]